MHTRTLNFVLGASALLTLGSSVAFAQAKPPTSTRRIPISKEGPAPVTRVDTVTVYKTDTLRIQGPTVTHTDTLRLTNTVTRIDTVIPPPPPVRLPSGVYFGLAGGVSAPNKAIFIPNSAGWSAQAQLGWQTARNLLGLRIDGNYAQPGEDSQFSQFQGNPSIVNLSGDVTLTLPWFHHLFGRSPSFALYALGGGTQVWYKDLPVRLNPGVAGGLAPDNIRVGPTDWNSHFGWNYGAGARVGFHRGEVFFETRIIDFNTDETPTIRQIPFMLGYNWYFGNINK